MDKLVMGTILGVAIGSVVGMSLAPKKKRKLLLGKGINVIKKGLSLFSKRKKENKGHYVKKIPHELE